MIVLPTDFEQEILPYMDETSPTPKEVLVTRIKERAWMKSNFKSVLNYLYSLNGQLFFLDDSGHIRIAGSEFY
jgi:hypothetical protein